MNEGWSRSMKQALIIKNENRAQLVWSGLVNVITKR